MKRNRILLPFAIVMIILVASVSYSSCVGDNARSDGDNTTDTIRYVELCSDTIPFVATVSDKSKFLIRTNDSITYFCDIIYPATSAHLYCTFRKIDETKLDQLKYEAGRLAYNHTVAASSITEHPVRNTYGAEGVLYEMYGGAATPFQLYLTDGVSYFFNASLYFDDGSHGDQVPGLVKCMHDDIDKLIYSFSVVR